VVYKTRYIVDTYLFMLRFTIVSECYRMSVSIL
jgi:hypothetical protein